MAVPFWFVRGIDPAVQMPLPVPVVPFAAPQCRPTHPDPDPACRPVSTNSPCLEMCR